MRPAGAVVLAGGALAVALVATGGSRAWSQQCDPYTRETPVPPTKPLAKTCGNGRVDDFTRSCVRHDFGGCGFKDQSSVVCEPGREACDGKALDGQSCESLGFGGGKLACRPGCEALDDARCTLCAGGSNCHDLVLPDRFAPTSDFHVVPRGNVNRAFWGTLVHDVPHEATATVGDDGRLSSTPVDLGTIDTIEIVALSNVWVTATHDGHDTILVVVGDHGVSRVKTGLPEGTVYVLPVSGRDAALVIGGDIASNLFQVAMVDGNGKLVPLPDAPLHARGMFDRVAIVPLAPGPATVGVGTKTMAVTAVAGDRLFGWMRTNSQCGDGCPNGAVTTLHGTVRDNHIQFPDKLISPSLSISAPNISIKFAPDADLIGGQTFAAPPVAKPLPGRGPFGSFADQVGVTRVPTRHGALLVATWNLDPEYRVAIAAVPAP